VRLAYLALAGEHGFLKEDM